MNLNSNEIQIILEALREKYGPGYSSNAEVSQLQSKLSIAGQLAAAREEAALCQHKKIVRDEFDSAVCKKCNKDFGWFCEESPSKHCEYEDSGNECCVYCGEPEERK